MNLHTEAVGRRYAMRPGCRLLGFRDVGIAVFAMNLRVLVVEPREMPPIEEFLLRFMGEGIDTVSRFEGLLGIDRALVRDRLVELRRGEFIDVVGESPEAGEQCRLTERGKRAVHELKQTTVREDTLPNVIFHGLLRRPIDLGHQARKQYLRPKEAKAADLTLIRPLPNRYPRPDEVDAFRLDQVVKSGRKRRPREHGRDIVAVKGVLKNVSTLYEPAVMLEYETADGKHERQVAFAVEGQLRDDYESAFSKARGPELLKDVLLPADAPIGERIRRLAPPTVIDRLGLIDDAENLANQVAVARQQVEDAKEQLESTDRADTKQVLRSRVKELESQLQDAEVQRNSRKVKYLWTVEIRAKLWEALRDAKERLLILSGWVSSEVVNDEMTAALRDALQRGVRIWIGYGFDKDKPSGQEQRSRASWKEAEASLVKLQEEFPNTFTFKDIGFTHEKRLICDNRFTFGGSFNLLSFSGERRGRGRLRHEGADLIEDEQFCDELYARYIKLFF